LKSDPPFHVPRDDPKAEVQYRLYFLDGVGHITRAHEFFAKDDATAIKISAAWREGRRMELWQRDRLVKLWDRA
jgi:hypothetical protein